jgi:lysophospholipase L1-like esterase
MAVIQSGVPWTSGLDDNTAGVAARNAAANAPAPGGTLDPAQYIDPDELAAALTALNVAQYVDASELTTALNALNVSQYTDATELAAAIAALNVSQYTDASELAAALSTYATTASVTSAIAAAPPKGSVPTATKTAAYTAAVGETVLVDVSDRFVNDAVYTNSSATVTSATAAFTSADIGRSLSISSQYVPPGATITAVASGTSATMSKTAVATGSSKYLGILMTAPVTAPASATAGSTFTVKKVDWSPSPVTVVPASGDDIDGLSSVKIKYRNVARTFVKGTGTSWSVAGGLVPVFGSPGSSTYDRSLPFYIPADGSLNNLRSAFSRVKAGVGNPAKILCKGDSTTYGTLGNGGNGAAPAYNPLSLTQPQTISWVDRCRKLLTTSSAFGGRVDEGAIFSPDTSDTRITLGTGWSASGGWTAASTATGTLTFADDNTSNAYDLMVTKTTGASTFTVTIDAESPQTVTVTSQTNATNVTYRVTSASLSTHSVVISAPNAASISIQAITPVNTTTPAIATMSRAGVSGQTLATYVGSTSQLLTGFWDNTLTSYKPDAAFLLMGINDMHNYSSGSIATNVATYKTNLTTFVTGCQALMCDPIFMVWPSRGYAGQSPSDIEAFPYHQAIYEVADDYGVPTLDLARRWGYGWSPVNYLAQNGVTPTPMYDGTHPTLAGYQDIAHMVASFLEQVV